LIDPTGKSYDLGKSTGAVTKGNIESECVNGTWTLTLGKTSCKIDIVSNGTCPRCGDGIKNGDEACDRNSNDGCTNPTPICKDDCSGCKASVSSGCANSGIAGKIYKSVSSDTISGATITISYGTTDKSDTSDFGGNYSITGITTSETCSVSYEVSALGYKTSTGNLTLTDGTTITIDFYLTPNSYSDCNQNGIREGIEECDGSDWGNKKDCTSFGFTSGTLKCSEGCTFDTSGCYGTPSVPRCSVASWIYCNPLSDIETIFQAAEASSIYIFGLIASVALLFLAISGVMYITSTGSEERISSSKRILTGTIIGLGIALLAYGLIRTIVAIFKAL